MATQLVPPVLLTVFENQTFFSDAGFYDGITAITGITSINTQYAFYTEENQGEGTLVTTWLPLPTGVTSQVNTYAGYQDFRLQGRWGKFTNDSDWTVRRNANDTSQTTYATYELVEPGYFSAQEYRADGRVGTSVIIRVTITGGGGLYLGTSFYATQTINNNWTRKRNQVIPFVQGGSSDATTFRFPGGSLGGSVGQDLPEPSAATGISLVPVDAELTTGSGIFTVPITVSSLTIILLGAGGAGGRGYAFSDYNGSGGGGGSGGYFEVTTSVTTGQQFAYSVGAPGVFNSSNRGQGGSTSFGPYSVTGGGVGRDGVRSVGTSAKPAGGAAGQPAGNAGNTGSFGAPAVDQVGGDGANAISQNLGQGGEGGDKNALGGVQGQSGTGFGAGGGGGGTARGTVSPWAGGDGLGGRIQLKYNGQKFNFLDTITGNTPNYNVRTAALAAGWDGFTPLNATITIASNVYVYSTSTSTPAFDYSNLPTNTTIQLTNNGYILGKGGDGGTGGNGNNGGPALVLNSVSLTITNNGTIAGGGGGGGGAQTGNVLAGGGGGAGGGDGGRGWTNGLSLGSAGSGGGPGAAGSAGTGASGGGGGRVLPGTGGARVTIATQLGVNSQSGGGGGAGGGGGGFVLDQSSAGAWADSGAGGGAGNNGNNATRAQAFDPGFDSAAAGGGGGGWAATGGNGRRATFGGSTGTTSGLGGTGGKAIETNGFDILMTAPGTIYGAVGGTNPINNSFSTAILSNQTNLNLRTYAVNNGWDQTATASVTVAGSVYVYSTSTATPGLTVDGIWPNGIRLNNYGYIMGCGGQGGGFVSGAAGNGGSALSIGLNIRLLNSGFIAGGGGGGAWNAVLYYSFGQGGGGGGGAGGGAGGSVRNAGGGAGGGPGAAGGAGADEPSLDLTTGAGGGGGGRIIPGSGGAGGSGRVGTWYTMSSRAGGGGGGGSGGGSGGIAQDPMTAQIPGVSGGSGSSSGVNGIAAWNGTNYGATIWWSSGGGGGGWGAAGGRAGGANRGGTIGPIYNGASGGRAIQLNGNTVTYFRIGAIWGAVS